MTSDPTSALSGDVEGIASSHPEAAFGATVAPAVTLPKGKLPASNPPVPAAQPSAAAPDRAPASASVDDSDNPFVGKNTAASQDQQPAQTAAPVDDSDNPFVDKAPPLNPSPAPSAVRQVVDANLQAHNAANPPPPPSGPQPIVAQDPIHDFVHGLAAGVGMSTSALAITGKMPDTILPEQADMAMRIGNQIGMLAGDLPAMIGGGLAGAAAGTVEAPVVGTIGFGAAGAFAAPAAIRKLLIDHIEGKQGDTRDFVASLMASTWEGIKGGVTGLATSVSGGLVTPVAGKLAGMGAELIAMTTAGSAMEGHLPKAQDFIDGAILLGGLHGAGHLTGFGEAPSDTKLREIYAKTGETPAQIIDQANRDVELKQQLIAGNAQEPPQATPSKLVHDTVKEPEPAEGEKAAVIGTDTKFEPKTAEEMGAASPPEPPKEPPTDELGELAQEHEDRQTVLSKIGVSDEPAKPTLGERWDKFYANNVDYLDPLAVAIKAATDKGAEITTSAYDLGRLAAAHMDKTRSFLEFGTRDGNTGEINGEGLNEIYKDVPGGDMNGLRAFAMAKHALDLDARGVEPWGNFDREAAQRLVDATGDQFRDVNQRRIDFSKRVLEFARDKGILSQDQLDRMDETNPNYSPSKRVMEADDFTGKVPGGTQPLKKIEGSARDIVDPILQTYKNTEMIIKRSLINETRTTFVDNMRAGDLLEDGDLNKNSEDVFLKKVSEPGKDTISMLRNGELEHYEGTPGVIDSLKRLDGDTTAMDLTTRILKGFSNAVRVGVVSNPAFGFAHFFRSQIMSSVYSETGLKPFQSLGYLKEFMAKGDAYQDWVYNGGASGSLFKLNDTYLKDNEVFAADKEAPFIGKAWNAVKSVGEASESFIKLTDNLSRFAEYDRSVKSGVNPVDAAMRARNVVPDYAMCGMQRSVLRTGVAFIGAHINSLDRMAQAIEEDPKGFAMKMSVISAMSVGLWAVNKDDTAMDAIPDWQKNTYWNINVSRFNPGYQVGRDDQSATILRLPKPWAPGILFGSGAEVALDQYFKDRPQEVPHFANSVMKSVLPELVPNIAQPILEQYSNKQSFTGRPLVPFYKEKLLPEMQYSPYTSETAKALGKLIGYVPLVKDIGPSSDPLASPAVVENYIKGWGGTMGGWALKLSDAGIAAATGNKLDKAAPWEDTPFIHSFVSRYPSFQDQRVQDFYENRDAADKAYNSAKVATKAGDFDAAERIRAAHPDFEVRLDSISKAMATARKTYENVQDDPSIPAVQKRQNLDTLLFQIGSMAKTGNQIMSDFHHGAVQNIGKGQGQ